MQNKLQIDTNSPHGSSEAAKFSFTSSSEHSDIIIEELHDELNKKFSEKVLKPYFKDLYKDLAQTRSQISPSGAVLVDRNAFVEFVNCPGIISERLFTLAVGKNKEERVEEANFVNLLLEVYSSTLDGKLKFVFKIFDLDSDGKITAEDVRLILSYVPRDKKLITSNLNIDSEVVS